MNHIVILTIVLSASQTILGALIMWPTEIWAREVFMMTRRLHIGYREAARNMLPWNQLLVLAGEDCLYLLVVCIYFKVFILDNPVVLLEFFIGQIIELLVVFSLFVIAGLLVTCTIGELLYRNSVILSKGVVALQMLVAIPLGGLVLYLGNQTTVAMFVH